MQQRRKPSPNLPEYKKLFLDALTQGLRLIDIKAIWSTWDAPYCDPLTVRQLWYEVKYRKKYDTGGKGRLPVGHLSTPRSQDQRDKIKAAVRSGVSFADFWSTATDWPRRDHQASSSLSSGLHKARLGTSRCFAFVTGIAAYRSSGATSSPSTRKPHTMS